MTKVLFVCLGNICRSPMAEFIFKDILEKAGVSDLFEVASAGTSSEEEGNPVYPPARAELVKHGISCAGKRAVQYTVGDYSKYDYIVVMEDWHKRSVLHISGDAQNKVFRLLDFTDAPADIDDPWYTRDFARAYGEIERGCAAFLEYLKGKGKLQKER